MRMVIVLNGGLVQDVFYAEDEDPEHGIIILDTDTDGLEDEEIVTINEVEYSVVTVDPVKDQRAVDDVFKTVWG